LIELNDLKYKRFVIEVRDHDTKEGDEHHYHMTPLMFVKGKWQCWDLDSVKNIWESIPIRCYAVKKLFNENDEEYYTNEWKRIRREQRRLLMRGKIK